jgi:serine/threonine protein kinase
MPELGKYVLKELIGKGGFGTVYRAIDQNLDRVVALKILHSQLSVDTDFILRFQREAQVIAALEHPNIVPIFDLGVVEGRLFIAMKYLPGGSLAERILQGSLPFEQVVEIMEDVCAGLQQAHSKGWIHRDVKPGNILFDADGHAVMGDFGLAKSLLISSSSSTQGLAGTPFYRSPEVWRGKPPVSPSTDVYALGCILYEMLTGKLLFGGDTLDEVITHHLVDGPEYPPGWPPSTIPGGVAELVKTALARDPAQRYADAAGFLLALKALQQLAALSQPSIAELDTVVPVPTRPIVLPEAQSSPRSVPNNRTKSRKITPMRLFAVGTFAVGSLVLYFILILTFFGHMARQAETSQAGLPAARTGAADQVVITATPVGGGSGHIAYTSLCNGSEEIYVMDVDGFNSTRVTNGGGRSPAWSPDGNSIAFISYLSGNREIYLMSADGSNLIRTNNSSNDMAPAWSPDGQRIAFISDLDEEIYVMNSDGTNLTRLTNNGNSNGFPSWSPDGEHIVFVSKRDENWEIYVMNADGSNISRLTNNNSTEFCTTWSPDGVRIAFVSDRDGDAEIYVMNPDGTNPSRLTNNKGDDFLPVWSPDGERIAFVSARDGIYEIYMMNADGSNPTRLTNNNCYDSDPAWAP